jgi:dihydrofolate reductase
MAFSLPSSGSGGSAARYIPSSVYGFALDELRLLVHPVVVGSGQRLFKEGGDLKRLKLVDSKTFSTGVLSLIYQSAKE